ncbi:hypothetical protein BHM03_00011928 [Ensete ventricosum]|uniref:Uncharacterized protein n=1 Tax=Ensete ventricosum TaxID=4639 RepID=A0A445MDI6_ENSVE|nr:hypothetical protein BHM03_00011928 [Ensete ventricosum]
MVVGTLSDRAVYSAQRGLTSMVSYHATSLHAFSGDRVSCDTVLYGPERHEHDLHLVRVRGITHYIFSLPPPILFPISLLSRPPFSVRQTIPYRRTELCLIWYGMLVPSGTPKRTTDFGWQRSENSSNCDTAR